MLALHAQARRRVHRRRRSGGIGLGLWAGAQAQQALLQGLVVRQLRHRHVRLQAPVDHHRNAVGGGGGHRQVLLDQQDGQVVLLGQLAQGRLHLRHDDRGQALGGLVHHQHPGLQQQRTANRQHLLLAPRELAAAVVASFGQARKQRVHPVNGRARWGHQAQGLLDTERGPHAPPLRDIGHAQLRDGMRGQAEDLAPTQAHAALRRHQAGQGLAQGGLAHAVAAHHPQHPFAE